MANSRLRALRHRLKSLLRPVRLPILGGPLSGCRWSVFTGLHHVLGDYEPSKTRVLGRVIREGDVVYDVGAHTGYYTLLASLRAGEHGRVVAFEPRPINLRFLRGHLEANGIENATVVPAAVGARSGTARFDASRGTGTGRLSQTGELTVETVTVDGVVRQGRFPPPDFIKVDVEGGELEVLRGAREVIETDAPRLLVAAHGETLTQRVFDWLEARDYRCDRIPADPSGDTEILAEPDSGKGPGGR